MKTITATIAAISLLDAAAFAPNSQGSRIATTELNGLFDGMKDAFTAPALDRSKIDAERETPIDRWMGWNVQTEEEESVAAVPTDFVDAMDESNYVITSISKPMGIVFEENDEEFGGIFVLSLSEDGAAEKDGKIKPGDQLVSVGSKQVSGLPFDDALGAIVDNTDDSVKLTFFRGKESQFYGPTGASKAWLDEFLGSAKE